MNRTNFIMKLAHRNQTVVVTDVGTVLNASKTLQNNIDSAEDRHSSFEDFESSGSKYIPPSRYHRGNETDESMSSIAESIPYMDQISKALQNDIDSTEDRHSSFEDFESSGSDYIPPSSYHSGNETDESISSITESIRIPCIDQITVPEDNVRGGNELPNRIEDELTLIPKQKIQFTSITIKPANEKNYQQCHLSPNKTTHEPSLEKNVKVVNSNITPTNLLKTNQEYVKKPSARETPTICPICFKDVITHFTRHLLRFHKNSKEVLLLKTLKPRSKERLGLVASLRKQGYFHLQNEKGVLNPVRNSKNETVNYFVCTYCLGYYSKKLLYKHVKTCKSRPMDDSNTGKNCLSKSQTFASLLIAKNHEYLKNSRIRKEVFDQMRADDISLVAKNDPIICLYGETLLNKHKRQQISTVISNKIREMARLLISLKSIETSINGLFDALKPEYFGSFVSAAKLISGYDVETKNFKAPSLALHIGTGLKILCDVALKLVVEKRNIPNITWQNGKEKKNEIKELKKLIEGHWCNDLSSLALKTLKEKHWSKPIQLPSTSDIAALQTYVNSCADTAYGNLSMAKPPNLKENYKILTQCVLTLTIMFNRKRVGDVQYLKMDTYTSNTNTINEEAFVKLLTPLEKILSQSFKRVVTSGKGSRPVPILFSGRLQKFISCLIKIRTETSIVPPSNPYLFANPGSLNRWMNGCNIMKKFANKCGAKNATLLTSTRFRKHIATTLQLLNMEENEMEQVATFMGHTKKTHEEFYRLPQDIYQTSKVAKVLLLLEKGKGDKFKGKSLNDINLEGDIFNSDSDENDEEDDSKPLSERVLERAAASSSTKAIDDTQMQKGKIKNSALIKMLNTVNLEESYESIQKAEIENIQTTSRPRYITRKVITTKKKTPKSVRHRWSEKEKKLVLKYFEQHIKKKVTPKKYECEQLISTQQDTFANINWVNIKTLVYNTFRSKN